MSQFTPLTAAELLAARAKHEHREDYLRRRGWQPRQPITRHDVYDFTLDRWLIRQGRGL